MHASAASKPASAVWRRAFLLDVCRLLADNPVQRNDRGIHADILSEPETKGPMANRFRRCNRLVAVLFAAGISLWVGTGCATSSNTPESQPAEEPSSATQSTEPQPGAAGWHGDALELPADSPLVFSTRPNDFLASARALRDWITAEPAMFGEQGERMITRFEQLWQMFQGQLGMDPLSEEAPRRFGFDMQRPVYLGLYPASSGQGAAFLDAIETTLRRKLELQPGESTTQALSAMESGDREIPSGLNASVLQAVESIHPRMGLRLVLPLQTPRDFVHRFERMIDALDYTGPDGARADRAKRDDPVDDPSLPIDRTYVDPGSQWPALKLGVQDTYATVDVLFRPFTTRPTNLDEDEPEARRRLATAIETLTETHGPGRPAAPQPAPTGMLTLSADQAAGARNVRLNGYKKILETLRNAGVEKRDDMLVRGFSRIGRLARAWEETGQQLSGVSYQLQGNVPEGPADQIFSLSMTVFGADTGERPRLETRGGGLDVEDRGFAVSMALPPLFDEPWRDWLMLDDPKALVGQNSGTDLVPMMSGLLAPRNFALFLVNVEPELKELLPEASDALYELRGDLERIELATAGSDPGALRLDPKLVALLSIDPETDAQQRKAVLESMRPIVADLMSPLETEGDEKGNDKEKPPLPELTPGTLEVVPKLGDYLPNQLMYYAQLEGPSPFIMLMSGLDREGAQAEIDRIVDSGENASRLFYARLEPTTFTSALTAFDPDLLEPLDAGIFAQRLGPLEVTITPAFDDNVRQLRYTITLKQPPEL
jgi:hypothetical protein